MSLHPQKQYPDSTGKHVTQDKHVNHQTSDAVGWSIVLDYKYKMVGHGHI